MQAYHTLTNNIFVCQPFLVLCLRAVNEMRLRWGGITQGKREFVFHPLLFSRSLSLLVVSSSLLLSLVVSSLRHALARIARAFSRFLTMCHSHGPLEAAI